MPKNWFIGVDGVARKVAKGYIGMFNFEDRNLPDGYTQVEKLQGTGADYINTGVMSTEDIVIKTKIVKNSVSTNQLLFGASWGSTDFSAAFYDGNFRFHAKGKYIDVVASGLPDEFEVIATQTNCTVNGVTYELNGTQAIVQSNIYIFNVSTGSGLPSKGLSSVKTFEMYVGGSLSRDYVPCVNSSGAAGLYDLVTGEFYGNAGTGTFVVGSTRKSVAKKIKKGYIGVNGIAQLFFAGDGGIEVGVSFTGNFTDEVVTMNDGKQYRLLTLTSSGTLTLSAETDADVWICSGGSNGSNGTGSSGSASGGKGGAGGKFKQFSTTLSKETAVVIGAATGSSSVGGITSTSSGSISGAGGGSGGTASTNYGVGLGTGGAGGAKAGGDTRPFADSFFTSYPCAGGGGGSAKATNYSPVGVGGGGGSSTGAGATGTTGNFITTSSAGGVTGGGSGCGYLGNAGAATYYGSGGGGGLGAITSNKAGASGYQGVCFIRIPLSQ